MLHALIHVVLAVTLPTAEFVVVSRVVGWSLIGAGIAGLIVYRRRTKLAPDTAGTGPSPSTPGPRSDRSGWSG